MRLNPDVPVVVNDVPSPALMRPADDEVSLRDLIELLREGRWLLAFALLIALVAGLAYLWRAQPIYQADALVQVETDKKPLNAALGDAAALLATNAPITAEIEIVKSRMVLGKVVDALGLEIVARPRYFPVIGQPIARRHSRAELRSPLFGLGRYAWGGERIRVTTLDVPARLVGAALTVVATTNGYEVRDATGAILLSGKPGETGTAEVPGGTLTVYVQDLVARPGTEFVLMRGSRASAVVGIAGALRVVERGRVSGILNVSNEGPDPALVTQITNELVTAYQKQNVERRSAEAAQTLEFLQTQLPQLKEKVEIAEAALNRFRLEQGSADLTKETELILQQSVTLEGRRVELMQEREDALRRFTDSHPIVRALDAQLKQIEGESNHVAARVKDLPDTQQELLRLSRDVEVNTQLYTSLLNNAQELQVAKAGTVGNVRVIDYAVPPSGAAKPNRTRVMALAAVLGVFLGMAAIFVRRALHHGVDDPSVVENRLGLPTYAAVPFSAEQNKLARLIKRKPGMPAETRILAQVSPDNIAIEALRSLRTSLHFAVLEAGNNIIALTGPSPGIGKSFVAMNFGVVLAMSGRRVAIVDADQRRGRLHEYAGLGRTPGLSDYIAGAATLDAVIQATHVPNLHLVTSGTPPPNPAELLLHERFQALLAQLSTQFDHVIVDTPPVLAVTDAAIIATHAGCTLLVLKSGEHPLATIEEATRRLRSAGANVRGTVFNQIGAPGTRYGGYKYNYYSQYKYAPERAS